MKVLIMSDSHGLTTEIDEITNRHLDETKLVIHCGDSELSKEHSELRLFKGVKGNCDLDSELPNELIEDLNGKTLYMTHGHLFNVKASLMNLKYRALEVNANIVCFGHSHIAGAEMIDGILFINPGSVRLPILRKQKTYAILDLKEKVAKVTFFDVNGQIIEELSQQFILE
jgi:uncharacterized protein